MHAAPSLKVCIDSNRYSLYGQHCHQSTFVIHMFGVKFEDGLQLFSEIELVEKTDLYIYTGGCQKSSARSQCSQNGPRTVPELSGTTLRTLPDRTANHLV